MKRPEEGFTFLWLMFFLAALSVSLSVVAPVWTVSVQRDREAELFRIGVLYAEAIEHYYWSSPGQVKTFPSDVDALLLDNRFPGTVRHLRRAYDDPMMPGHDLGFVRGAGGGIVGVFSQSDEVPILRTAWSDGRHLLPRAETYQQWHFIANIGQ